MKTQRKCGRELRVYPEVTRNLTTSVRRASNNEPVKPSIPYFRAPVRIVEPPESACSAPHSPPRNNRLRALFANGIFCTLFGLEASNVLDYFAVCCRFFLTMLRDGLAQGGVRVGGRDYIAAREKWAPRAFGNNLGLSGSPIHPRLQCHLVLGVPLINDRNGDCDYVVMLVQIRRTRTDGQQQSCANISTG